MIAHLLDTDMLTLFQHGHPRVYEEVDDDTVIPVTAYEVPKPKKKRK
jgi:hypothetical protein